MVMESKRIFIYHITHISNIVSIINNGGLYCINSMHQSNRHYKNIAYGHIQDRRGRTRVPVEPYGTLHDYVPFYFAPRSPMLYTIDKGNVPGYDDGQKLIVYLVSSIERVNVARPWVFTDGHGTMAFTSFYNDLNHLDEVDWNVMRSRYWFDTPDDPDRSRRRQAEFLVSQQFPLGLAQVIGVYDTKIKQKLETMFDGTGYNIPIKVYRDGYY